MEEQPMQGMWGRFALFFIFSMGLLFANTLLMSYLAPPKPAEPEQPAQVAEAPGKAPEKSAPPGAAQAAPKEAEKKTPAKPDVAKGEPKKPPQETPKPAAEPKVPDQWVTLGSLDPDGSYRMLVTLTNRGAAVRRIELTSPRFRELDDRSGYLGHVVADDAVRGSGCAVQVVGRGTPAEEAGLTPGDSIQAVNDQPVTGSLSLAAAMHETRPGQTVQVKIVRNGQEMTLPVKLTRRPLEIIRPEGVAPPSFLAALTQIDDTFLASSGDADAAAKEADADKVVVRTRREIDGAVLTTANWEIVSRDESHVTFRRVLPQWELEVQKTFRLATVDPADVHRADAPDYHLSLEIDFRNTGKAVRKVAYSLDGPNGLPTEGWWYANKVSHSGSSASLRDVIVSFHGDIHEISSYEIGKGGKSEMEPKLRNEPMSYVGIDAQYFAVVMLPERTDPTEIWFSQWQPLRYGTPEPDLLNLTNTSVRVTSTVRDLNPGAGVQEKFTIFAGPKRPELLSQYDGLADMVTYGWFGPVAKLLLGVLHGFYRVIPNYGIAIILLTVLVRSCMFPLSRKQALSAQKMQEIQPEIKKLQEKYKNDLQARGKAQQELFRKHGVNPMSGCLVLFLQLPVFIGLYRALMVDVELRQAPLISESIRWASNLAAPDMLFNWSGFMPGFISRGTGMFGLGPYFNLLPIITIVLFIWQQKKFMPPAMDEQQAMQQKIMQYMMIFMGILFFKVASGLCIYFIASSLWSIAERRFLPKAVAAGGGPAPSATPQRPLPGRDGTPASRRKSRGQRD